MHEKYGYNIIWKCCMNACMDLDKAVMEMKPEKRSSHPSFLGDCFCNDGFDDLLCFRA